MIDRLTAMKCPLGRVRNLPLIKTGGLADVTGALPGALAAEGVAVRSLVPGYPAVLDALAGESVLGFDDLFGGPARVLAGRAGASTCSLWTRRISMRAPGSPYAAPRRTGPTMRALRGARLGRQPRSAAARSPDLCPMWCTRMTGRRDWPRPICITAAGGGRAR